MNIIEKTVKDIKDLKIQGATSVARAGLLALQKLKINPPAGGEKLKIEELRKAIKELKTARPTEPLLFNCLDYVYFEAKKLSGLNHLTQVIDNLVQKLERIQEKIVENGVELIKPGMRILTHCHSSAVVGILKKAKQRGIKFEVFLTETRPLYQGRITAQELVRAGIKATMVVDGAATYLVSKESEVAIDLVLLGCDVVYPQKGILNKIGSYGIALSSHQADVPVYIAGSLMKISKHSLPIEERGQGEIWQKKPENLSILNLAFDFVPMKFITGIITEFGIIKPNMISQLVEKHHPFILCE